MGSVQPGWWRGPGWLGSDRPGRGLTPGRMGQRRSAFCLKGREWRQRGEVWRTPPCGKGLEQGFLVTTTGRAAGFLSQKAIGCRLAPSALVAATRCRSRPGHRHGFLLSNEAEFIVLRAGIFPQKARHRQTKQNLPFFQQDCSRETGTARIVKRNRIYHLSSKIKPAWNVSSPDGRFTT